MTDESVNNVKHKSNLPQKESDLVTVTSHVVAKWKEKPEFTLIWTNTDELTTTLETYNNTVNTRLSIGGGRKGLTQKLVMLDADIDLGITAIKSYLVYKYEKPNAAAYYPQFGIQKQGSNLILPRDRNKRNENLPLIVTSITTHGFESEKYGLTFWQETTQQYDALLKQASKLDGSVSVKVGDKKELRKTIVKILKALIKLIQANYPDTYPAVLREWGFQKEKY